MNKKKLRLIILSLMLAAVFGFIGYEAYGTGVYRPGASIELTDIADVAVDAAGNSYVLNNGGYEVLRINTDGEVELAIKGLGGSEKSFERGIHIAVDNEGNIYIHNRIASEDALSWIGEENIKVYDKNGKYLYTAGDIEYEVPVLKPAIISLQNINGEVYAFSTDEWVVLASNVANGDLSMYEYPFAEKYICAATYDSSTDSIYATTRDGKIVRLAYDKYEVMYCTPFYEKGAGAFTDIDMDEAGNIIVCDARAGTVSVFDGERLKAFFNPKYITYSIDYNKSYIFNETYSIILQEKSHYYSITEAGLAGLAQNRSIIFVFAMLFMVLALLYPVYCVVNGIVRSESEKVRIIAGLTAVVAVLTVSFCMLVSREYSTILSEDLLERALLNAQLVNNVIDAEDFRSLDSVSDYNSDAYNRIKEAAEKVILDDGKFPGDMYLIMYTLGEDGTVTVRYSIEEVQGCNYPYVWSDGTDEAAVYETGESYQFSGVGDAEGSFLCVYAPVEDSKGAVIGVIEVGTDITIFQKQVRHKLYYFAMSVVALAAVFILLILELFEFAEAKKGYPLSCFKNGETVPPLKIYRIAVFAVFFITNITTPFLSIYALSLSEGYTEVFGMPAEMLAAVPISAEVLFGAIFSMIGGNIIEKLGTRKAGILGAIMFTAGLAVRFFYPDLIVLTIGNAIQGSGWGIFLLIINSRIAAEEDEQIQEQGFTDYNIALQNGINSGIVLGGFLLAFASYSSMLVIAALISCAVLAFAYFFIFNIKENNIAEAAQEETTGNMSYLQYILSPRVLAYFLCIVVPVIAASYYLNFLYPILGDNLGMSESIIGYSYLINGVVIICFGNMIVNFMSKYFDRKVLLLIASVLYLITFAIVGLMNSIPALLISLVLLGVSDSFGYVAQSTFYTDLNETKAFGYEKAMGVYSLFENLSQSAGSFVFGYILTVGVKVGMTAYGIVIGVCAAIFVLVVVLSDRLKKEPCTAE